MKCRLIEPIGVRYEVLIKNGDSFDRIKIENYSEGDWDKLKEQYGDKFEGVSTRKVWNTEDGENNHPGDMYWANWMHGDDGYCIYWDNCKDPRGHLVVVLANGFPFDCDSRASNCNKPNDRTHRCWGWTGEPPNVTLGSSSSDNGVGSIGAPGCHCYLRNGELVT